jgi:hypothetical protein
VDKDDLNKLWVCSECQSSFAFRSDVIDHRQDTGHKSFREFDLNAGRLIEEGRQSKENEITG